ncbi:MAG: MtrB/PioB family decaheme-associated outer membrane protein [Gallionellaceae bacterium]|nr:MtrB/PioB family decaheme-associated outer membrane protein [Gallionellaceae bacterium]MDD5367167.1 MtrB/PioB family decaheme-associated outer membrane protein [Gallionellaceae bacterium]
MNTAKIHASFGFSQKLLVLALMAAFGPAHADDDEVTALISPDVASVTAGAGHVSGNSQDRSLYGQYSGWAEHDNALLLDFRYIKREEETGTWTRGEGLNLGQDDRELSFSQEKQGDWKLALDYSELVHRDPRTINTGLLGAGTTSPTVSPLSATGTGNDLNLELRRKAFNLAGSKWITPNLSFEASFRNEDKDGARSFGIGGYTPGGVTASTVAALYLVPEPVNSTTRQFEARLHYFGDKFSLTGGYNGSFYNNANSTMTVNGIDADAFASSTLTLALPPDNQAHQLYLSGTYALQPTTHANFKLAYTHASQNQGFGSLGAGSLDGVLDTTLAQVGLSARPMPKLSLTANLRYEDRNDKTALGNYLVDSSGNLYTNTPDSSKYINGKLEASYQFSSLYRGTLGVDYAYINRDRVVSTTLIPDTSMAALRERTNEWGVRAEVRRSMSETVNAAVILGHSERQGYHWYGLDPSTGYAFVRYDSLPALDGTFPVTLLDRERNSIKLMTDWSPSDALSLQFWLEDGLDHYSGPTAAGVHANDAYSFNIDASYKLSDKWKLTGYASTGKQTLHMQQSVGYIADLADSTATLGVGAVGQISSKIELGGDLSYLKDKNRYNLDMTTGAAVSDLPDVSYRATTLKLYGKYKLSNVSDVRVDLIQQWAKLSEWTWGSDGVLFAYTDNTTVALNPSQDVTFIGARYTYRFK